MQPEKLTRPSRQLPAVTPDTVAFWTGGERGELLINRCLDCHHYHHPPVPVCFLCLSKRIQPTAVSGRGSVVSFTINHQAWLRGMPVPFIVAYVAIDEQPDVWLLSNIMNCAPERVFIGLRVRVCFERQEDLWIPLFTPETVSD